MCYHSSGCYKWGGVSMAHFKASRLRLLHSLVFAICAIAAPAFAYDGAKNENSRFLEFRNDIYTRTFDLSTVCIIQPGRFIITKTEIDHPDIMRFELKVLIAQRPYCARVDGNYPVSKDLFTLGPPELIVEGITVKSKVSENKTTYKSVEWYSPYKRLEHYPIFLTCKQFDRTEDDLYVEHRNLITNGVRSIDLYDCKRGLYGWSPFEDENPANTLVYPVPKNTLAFEIYLSVCKAVTHEAPYLPS
jgi:hypothetical protein